VWPILTGQFSNHTPEKLLMQMARFREVISSIPMEIRLEHFLNDGDSPNIPIPVYVGYLNQIRDMARAPK
jgi:hypothetical protein